MTLDLHIALLGLLLAVACASDLADRRIPNALVVPVAVFGLAAQWLSGGPWAALGGALGGSALLAVLFLPWAAGKLGGGDVKLAAAVAIWLAPAQVPTFLLYSSIAGIPVALGTRLAHQLELRRTIRTAQGGGWALAGLASGGETVPLAVAISLGAFAVLRWGTP